MIEFLDSRKTIDCYQVLVKVHWVFKDFILKISAYNGLWIETLVIMAYENFNHDSVVEGFGRAEYTIKEVYEELEEKDASGILIKWIIQTLSDCQRLDLLRDIIDRFKEWSWC